jgi:glycosyltransferase involved in cell wall biosynthesis
VTPTVSIGLPVYNGERFLRRSLDALLGQSFRDFELVISDNASTDGTPQIISEYAAADSRVRHMRAAVNAGVEANFRRVLNESIAPYFMWAGCDDWWAPTFVERAFAALERDPNAVVAMSDVQREDENGKALDTVRFSGPMDPSRMTPARLALMLAGGRPFHLFVYGLFRADVLRRTFTGFAPVVAADRLLMCRMALTGGFVPVGDVLHKRLIRRASIAERYGDEGIGQLWHNTSARWRLAFSAGPYLWRSPGIPFRRKLLIPAIVLRFAKASLGHSLVQSGLIGPRGGPRAHAC